MWDQEVVSENRDVYRAEYLAYQMLLASRVSDATFSRVPAGRAPSANDARPAGTRPNAGVLSRTSHEELLAEVQRFMGPRYSEGYSKGVHDHDAALLLQALLEIDTTCGLLRYSSRARTLARVFWEHFGDKRLKTLMSAKLDGFSAVAQLFPGTPKQREYIDELRQMLVAFVGETGLFAVETRPDSAAPAQNGEATDPRLAQPWHTADDALLDEAADYLFHELTDPQHRTRGGFCIAQAASDLVRAFHEHLRHNAGDKRFSDSLKSVQKTPGVAYELARDWVSAYVNQASAGREPAEPAAAGEQSGFSKETGARADCVDEAAACLLAPSIDPRCVIAAGTERDLAGLIGIHPVLDGGRYHLNFNRFLHKLERFERDVVPRFKRYHELKTELVQHAREEIKLEEFKPRVLTSFVRNRLIDSVYLPLIGDNLAKQVGTTGEGKRTDRQGLLLLISPPGYGKTTLMEYIANRLGIIFMKINGPAIGHGVTSADPAAAPNAGAREEVEKLNLAFEMGDNVMIYLDDIQHCHPELLQKFITLCDAQRKIEGVWKGRTRTYDFRGRKVCVVMAGNPYTESGEKFRVPDMLANRADIYNLGEIIGDSREAFELSYLENALTSNPVLAKLAARSQKDVYAVISMAERAARGEGTTTEGVELEGNYSLEELNEFVGTMRKLMRVRDVVLTINRQYIQSAATHDDYRTEPPFLLQGSYRNMNRIAEKVLPVMNDAELETLIVSSYQNDAQTLTTGTESNLLKFKELLGILTPEERQRWEDITRTFRQNVKLRGVGSDDKVGLVIAQMSTFADGLDAIRKAVHDGVGRLSEHNGDATADYVQAAVARIDGLNSGLQALSDRIDQGLAQISRLAERPIQVEVPPVNVTWPQSWPAAPPPPTAAPVPPAQAPARAGDEEGPEITGAPPHAITVVNRLPRTMLNVLEQQFQLMHGWLKPLAEMSAKQQTELSTLRPMVEDCLRHYRVLLKKLEQAHDRDAEGGTSDEG